MRVILIGQSWLGAESLTLLRRRGDDVALVIGPASIGDKPDRLFDAGRQAGLATAVGGRRVTGEQIPPGCDLIVAAHSHAFITREAREKTRLGALGYHPSLLPRHRGRDAVRWTIHMRDAIAGGTVYWMDDGADTGLIAAQGWCHVRPNDTPETLWRRSLGPMGIALLDRVLGDLDCGVVTRVPQNESDTTWEPSFRSEKLSGGGAKTRAN